MPVIALPDSAIGTVDTEYYSGTRQFASWGPHVFFRYADHRLMEADAQGGTIDRIASARGWFSDGGANATSFVWAEASWNMRLWKISIQDAATGEIAVVDRGTLPRPRLVRQVVAVDGDQVAYTIDNPRPDHPQAASIFVRNISTGEIIARIESDEAVADISLSGNNLALVSGHVNTKDLPGPFFETYHVVLVTLPGGTLRTVGDGGQAVAIAGDRLYWDYEPPTQGGLYDTQVLATTTEQPTPAELVPGELDPYGTLAVGEGLVAWTNRYQVLIYDEASATAVVMLPEEGMGIASVSIGGGWVSWSGRQYPLIYRFHAARIADIRAAAGWE